MSGEQAEERTAREIRKIAEAAAKELFADKYFRETALASNNHDDHAHAQEIAAAVIEKACSRLASRVEELEKELAVHKDLFWPPTNEEEEHVYEIRNGKTADYVREHVKALLAGAPAEEKE